MSIIISFCHKFIDIKTTLHHPASPFHLLLTCCARNESSVTAGPPDRPPQSVAAQLPCRFYLSPAASVYNISNLAASDQSTPMVVTTRSNARRWNEPPLGFVETPKRPEGPVVQRAQHESRAHGGDEVDNVGVPGLSFLPSHPIGCAPSAFVSPSYFLPHPSGPGVCVLCVRSLIKIIPIYGQHV